MSDRKYTKNDLIRFLKEYAKNTARDIEEICEIVSIPVDIALQFVERYSSLMINTISDADFPDRVYHLLNKNMGKQKISREEIHALSPLIEKYGNVELIDSQQVQDSLNRARDQSKSNIENFDDLDEVEKEQEENLSTEPIKRPPEGNNDRFVSPVQAAGLSGAGAINIAQGQGGKFAYLANASNPDLMRWALMQNRFVQPASVEKWINIFEANEDRYMMNPFMLQADMKEYFSDKPGDISFKQFVQLVKDFGRKNSQFFKNPYFEEPQQPQEQRGGSSYHYSGATGYSHPALPPGMPVDHPMAERLIRDYEQDRLEERLLKRKELEKAGVREGFEDYLRAMTIDLMQSRKMDQGGNGAMGMGMNPINNISSLITAGIMVPVQTIDSNGNIAIRYEPRNIANASAPLGAVNGNGGGLGMGDMLKLLGEAYGKSNEILMKYIEARGGEDDIGRFEKVKRLADLINPPQNINIEAQRLKLEERRLDIDHDILATREQREESRYRWEQEMKMREESKGQEQADKLFGSISDLVTNKLLPVFSQLFQGQGGQFQMPGSVGEALGKLMGGGQQQQAGGGQTIIMGQPQQQQGAYNPYQDLTASGMQGQGPDYNQMVGDQQYANEIRRMQEAQKMERQRAIMEAQTQAQAQAQPQQQAHYTSSPLQEQQKTEYYQQPQQQQPQQQQQQRNYDQPISYSEQDFDNLSNDEVVQYYRRGQNAIATYHSFDNTITNVMKKRGIIKEQETHMHGHDMQPDDQPDQPEEDQPDFS